MTNSYIISKLHDKVSFRFDGWFNIRKNHLKETAILWLKNDRMMVEADEINNSKTAILFFKN